MQVLDTMLPAGRAQGRESTSCRMGFRYALRNETLERRHWHLHLLDGCCPVVCAERVARPRRGAAACADATAAVLWRIVERIVDTARRARRVAGIAGRRDEPQPAADAARHIGQGDP